MAIISIDTSQTGQVSVLPSFASINTSDTEATILGTGYLNKEVANGASFNLPCIAKVSSQATPTSAQKVGWYNVTHVAPNWSLTSITAPGDVTLPTIVNHFIGSTDTLGTLANITGTMIQSGSIQAGTTAIAGALISTAGTANGTLQLKAVTNGGNFNGIISNAALAAQSSTWTLADPVSATSNILQAPAALVSGNFPKNSGTAGLVVDSGLAVSAIATTSTAVLLAPAGDQTITAHNLIVSAGNISAGSTSNAQSLISFPGTGNGTLALTAVSNGGAFNAVISNTSLAAQSSTYSLPDPVNAAARILVGATATPFVSGNFPQNSGTGGLMVDSGVTVASLSGAITQLGQLYQVKVTFNTASMVTAYDTPLTIVANPAASQVILILQASVYTASTGNTAYATGTGPIIQYSTGGTNGQHGLGTLATGAGLATGDITAASSQVRNLAGLGSAALTGLSGKGLYFSNATGDYTAGTGTSITVTVVYQLLTATI